jgi:hypothetical protein
MNKWTSLKTFPLRIFIIALILRLIPVVAMRSMGIGLDDMFQYDMLARSMVAGDGYRWYAEADLPLIQSVISLDLNSTNYDPRGVLTSFRPPLYPAFLALIYFVFGVGAKRFFIARLIQTVLGASLAPLTFSLARRFFPERPRIAIFAAYVITFYPMLVIYPLSLATENLFFVLVLSSILVLLMASEKHGWYWFAFGGILLGLMSLTRSVSLAFAGLAVLWIWFVLREHKMAILVFGMVSLVTLPWMARNTLLFHRLTGIESALGYDVYLGYHPNGTGTFKYPESLDLMSMLDDGERDAIGRQKAMEFIKADPGRFPYLVVRRAGYFFGLERRALTYFYSNNFFGYIPPGFLYGAAAILCLPFVVVSICAVFGLALAPWGKRNLLMMLFFIGYITPHLFILGEDRFHLTIVPFLAILCAYFWTSSRSALRERWKARRGKIALLLASLAVLFLVVNWGLELWRDAGKLALLFGPNGNTTFFTY